MTTNKNKGPLIDPGKCRCCGGLKKCRILNVEYEFLGETEVYSDMFVDCFGLMLSHLEGEVSERLICATCVMRLREAQAFRMQVLSCEQLLLLQSIQVHDADVDSGNHKNEPKDMDDGLSDVDSTDKAPFETELIQVDIEPMIETEPDVTSRKTRSTKIPTKEESTKAKKEMLLRLKKMKQKLKKLQDSPQGHQRPVRLQKLRQPTVIDKELNAFKNTVTIVETSYVCPFINVFSDYQCVYCKEIFIDPAKLREHTLTHDPKTYEAIIDSKKLIQIDVVRIDCRLCPESIDSIESLKRHITTTHGKVIHSDVSNEFIKYKLKLGTLSCYECEETFTFFHALKKHMAVHFGAFICDVCGAHYFEERHLTFHKTSHDSKKDVQIYPCVECDKSFRSKNSLNFHVTRIHKNEPAYQCNKCEESFISYHLRYRHKIDVHGERRCFPCDGCTKIFDSRKALREHNQKSHLQLLRHECGLCDRKFYLPSALRDHMTSHTGERNYRCEFCGKNYPRSKALKVHLQSHSAEKKYKCSLCPRSYTQVTNYKNHLKTKHPLPANSEGFG